jgi:hypothetical protein
MRRIVRGRQVCWLCLVCGIALGALEIGRIDAPSLGAQEKPPARATLAVELRAQETEWWCWAATGQMTMEFFGKEVSQSVQADLAFRRTDCGQKPVPRPCVRGGEITIRPFGFTHEVITRPLTPEGIIRQIHFLHKPIPFAWRFPGGGGHAALAVGYFIEEDGDFFVECLDPYPPPGKNPRFLSGGHRVFVPYPRWCKDYDHNFALAYYNVTRKP